MLDTPEKLAAIEELALAPDVPPLARDLWATFLALHFRRPQGFDGPLRFTWGDLKAYCELSGARFDPWKLRVIFLLEDAYFSVRAESKDKEA